MMVEFEADALPEEFLWWCFSMSSPLVPSLYAVPPLHAATATISNSFEVLGDM